MFTDIGEGVENTVREIEFNTSRVVGRINTAQAQIRAGITESTTVTGTRIGAVQVEITAGFAALEASLVASRELGETTKLILVGAIAGVAAEAATILGLAGSIEVAVLFNRGLIRSEAWRTRRELTTVMRDTGRTITTDVNRHVDEKLRELTTKVEKIGKDCD